MSVTIPANCSTVDKLETPPGIDPSGKYVVIVNQFGVTRLLTRPANTSVLAFDGDDIYFVDGTDALPLILNNLKLVNESGVLGGVVAQNIAGRFFRFVNETAAEMVIKSSNGQMYLAAEGAALNGLLAPLVGTGFLTRSTLPAAMAAWNGVEGLQYVTNAADGISITNGTTGQILTMVAGAPAFADPSSGAIATGTANSILEGVRAASTGVATVNVLIPSFVLTDGATTVSVTNVNVTVNLAGAVGLLGLDTGGEAASKWYYVYVTSDGVGAVSAIISESATAPDLTATGHTFYGMASVFRNDAASNIIAFTQKGRTIDTAPILWGNELTITTSLAAIASGTPLTTIVPPIVKSLSGIMGGSTAATIALNMVIAADNNGLGAQVPGNVIHSSSFTLFSFRRNTATFYNIPILDPTAPALSWMSFPTEAAAGASDVHRRIMINGYKI